MPRICVIMPGLGYKTIDSNVIKMQPWNYLFQIALSLNNRYSNVGLAAIDTTFSQDFLKTIKEKGVDKVNDLMQCKHIFVPIAFGFLLNFLKSFKRIKENAIFYGILTSPLMSLLQLLHNYIIIKSTNTSITVDSLLRENIVFNIRKNILSKVLNKIIVPSKDYERILYRRFYFKHKVTVYYPVINCERGYTLNNIRYKDDDAIVVTYFGAFSEERGVISLLKAIKSIASRHRKVMFQLLLRRTGSRNIEKYSRLLVNKDNMNVIIGDLPRKKLYEKISLSKIIILPYRVIPSTVPLVYLESILLYRNIPVVSTLIPGIREHVVRYMPEELLLAPTFSVKKLVDVLTRIIVSEKIYQEISSRQNMYAKELCERISSQRLELV